MILAIDPGASGGIAIEFIGMKPKVLTMPETDADIVAEISDLAACATIENVPKRAVLEKVGGYVGGSGQPGSAMFNFGHNVGVILGALLALGFRIERPTPQQWQKLLGIGTRPKKMSKTDWKNKLKAKAQELYPDQKVTLKTADALLILEAAKRASF